MAIEVCVSKYKDLYTSVSYNSTDMDSLRNDLSTKLVRNGYDEHCVVSSISVSDAISKLKCVTGDGNRGVHSMLSLAQEAPWAK